MVDTKQSWQALHLVWFIRDTALERLVSSLKYPPFYTRSVSYSSLIFWTNPHSPSLISYQPQKLPTAVSQYLKISLIHGEIFEYRILLSFHVKVQCCVHGGSGSKYKLCLLPTELQVVSPNLQITVVSYFYRGD